jgi:hypothetical protein
MRNYRLESRMREIRPSGSEGGVKGQVNTLLDIDRVVAPDTVQAMAQAAT